MTMNLLSFVQLGLLLGTKNMLWNYSSTLRPGFNTCREGLIILDAPQSHCTCGTLAQIWSSKCIKNAHLVNHLNFVVSSVLQIHEYNMLRILKLVFFSFIVEHSNVPVLVYTFTPTGSQSTLGITSLSGCNL